MLPRREMIVRSMFYAVTALGLSVSPMRAESPGAQPSSPSDSGKDPVLRRSVVSLGDVTRVQHALAKARRGEKVVVAVIGGSITAGACASKPERRYGNVIAAWWWKTFPKADITFVNAGIGATGSDIGAHRAAAHLLKHRPDFVVVEYAVNDGGSKLASETLEGLIRQILKQPNCPAAMLLFMMNKSGHNVQDAHIPIGRHYGLPMVSFRDALWPEIEAGRIKWEDVEADEVHPNDRGHQLAADYVTGVLESVWAKLPPDDRFPKVAPLSKPKISDVFEHVTFLNADTITPKRNEGWTVLKESGYYSLLFGPGWRTDKPGSVIEFEVEASAVSVMFWRIKGNTGIAEAQVDDGPPVKLNGWFGATWGGYMPFQLVARDLKPGPHTLRLRLLDEKSKESNGHEFRLHAIMLAGLKRP
ncbi:MAG: hypothetical protein JXQ73_25310 [Phycisphaerae bacterium]|nr:hypothetical protein [Phycisphaerae bacterium]